MTASFRGLNEGKDAAVNRFVKLQCTWRCEQFVVRNLGNSDLPFSQAVVKQISMVEDR